MSSHNSLTLTRKVPSLLGILMSLSFPLNSMLRIGKCWWSKLLKRLKVGPVGLSPTQVDSSLSNPSSSQLKCTGLRWSFCPSCDQTSRGITTFALKEPRWLRIKLVCLRKKVVWLLKVWSIGIRLPWWITFGTCALILVTPFGPTRAAPNWSRLKNFGSWNAPLIALGAREKSLSFGLYF